MSHDPALSDLEQRLRALAPLPGALDRDATLFRAGRASARGRHWPTLTAGSLLLALGLGVALAVGPAPEPLVRTVVVRVPVVVTVPPEQPDSFVPVSAPVAEEPQTDDPVPPHRKLQDHLLRWGFDGLEVPPPSQRPPPTADDLLKSL